MRYYRLGTGETAELLAESDRTVFELVGPFGPIRSFSELARLTSERGDSIDRVASGLIATDNGRSLDAIRSDLSRPVVPDEVWAAGVTYQISEQAREEESDMPEIYLRVYDADRPELFFKATASRTVGPGAAVGIRADSTWDVPEPELGVVLYEGQIVGYTIGNDMSSRDIEGQNPLYLPQAKIYDRCCAIGPAVASVESVGDPHELDMSMHIERAGELVFEDETSTAEMVRTCAELVDYWRRHNTVPTTAVLLTGTSLVPPDRFTLQPDDVVSIDISRIGTLTNPVVQV